MHLFAAHTPHFSTECRPTEKKSPGPPLTLIQSQNSFIDWYSTSNLLRFNFFELIFGRTAHYNFFIIILCLTTTKSSYVIQSLTRIDIKYFIIATLLFFGKFLKWLFSYIIVDVAAVLVPVGVYYLGLICWINSIRVRVGIEGVFGLLSCSRLISLN